MAGISVKDEEEALFTRKGKAITKTKKAKAVESKQRKESTQPGGVQQNKNNDDLQKRSLRRSIECYNYGKKGHFVRDCWFRKKKIGEGNSATMTSPQSESEEDWEEQASLAIVEETKMPTSDATDSVIFGSYELALGAVAEEHEETAHTVSCPKDINYDKD